MIAAHENSLSDDFVTEVFELFDILSKDVLYGMDRFSNQKKVLEISSRLSSVNPPPEVSEDEEESQEKEKEDSQEYYLGNSPSSSPIKGIGRQRSDDDPEERQKFKDVVTLFQDWICNGTSC